MTGSQHNPYAPPRASVAESSEDLLPDAPPPVKTAMKLLWISFVLTYIEVALDWAALTAETPLIFFAIGVVLMTALQIWIYLKIALGRNWARIAWLVLSAVSLPILITDMVDLAQRAPVAAGITLIDVFLVFYALYLLFFPGREWFRARSE
ncbi:MAG: hypothetical protein H7Y89_04555 [Steroidobacteraceae bacterium]|nr:hypothetical protein [Steroidobacteraceae bacterium]